MAAAVTTAHDNDAASVATFFTVKRFAQQRYLTRCGIDVGPHSTGFQDLK